MQRLMKDAATSTGEKAAPDPREAKHLMTLARNAASYAKVEDLGPSVFCTIRDALGLDPRYKPHRNVDAVRCAKLMSRLIKEKLCKRALNEEGRLCWRFLDDATYDAAIEILIDRTRACFCESIVSEGLGLVEVGTLPRIELQLSIVESHVRVVQIKISP